MSTRQKVTLTLICALVLLVFASTDSTAQQIGFKGIGGRLGLVSSGGSTIIFGVHANLGEIIENLVIFPSIDYWSKNNTGVFSINGNVRYYFPTGGNIDFFAGGGLSLMRWSWDGYDTGLGTVGGGSDIDFGLNLLGGVDIPVQDNLVASAKIIFNTHGDQLKIMGGITFLLGGSE